MNNTKVKCSICNREITNNNIVKHTEKCSRQAGKVRRPNPRNTGKAGRNQYMKALDEGRPIPAQTTESKAKAIETKSKNGTLLRTEETRKKMSASMKRVVLAKPESYSSSNRGRTRQQIVDGIKLQGQWEVDFYLWAKAAGLAPERPAAGFSYVWNGLRTYFPDFYLPSLELYVEVKGYETERDRAKWLQFPKKLRIIKAAEIKQIRKNTFPGL